MVNHRICIKFTYETYFSKLSVLVNVFVSKPSIKTSLFLKNCLYEFLNYDFYNKK